MKKLQVKISVLKALLQNPKEIITLGYQSKILKKSAINYEQLLLDKFHIRQLPIIDLLDLFPGLHDVINVYSFLPGTSLITDLLLLKGLAGKITDCSYLEIGSFRGESLATVAEVAKDCTSITLSEDEMRALKFSEGLIVNAGFFSKNIPNLTTYLHNSLTFDFSKLNGKKFDLVFIDGELSYNAITKDTAHVLQLLRNDASIIVWHEYAVNPEKVNHEVLLGMLDAIPKEAHANLYHVSNTKCAVLMKGNFKTTMIDSKKHPDKVFRVEVAGRKI